MPLVPSRRHDASFFSFTKLSIFSDTTKILPAKSSHFRTFFFPSPQKTNRSTALSVLNVLSVLRVLNVFRVSLASNPPTAGRRHDRRTARLHQRLGSRQERPDVCGTAVIRTSFCRYAHRHCILRQVDVICGTYPRRYTSAVRRMSLSDSYSLSYHSVVMQVTGIISYACPTTTRSMSGSFASLDSEAGISL